MSQHQYVILADRITSLQNHIHTINIRLQSIQKVCQLYLKPKSNPLEKYLAQNSFIQSIQYQDSKMEFKAGKHHSRYRSQTFGNSPIIKRFQDKQKTIDSKSFGMIKRSILLNEQQMEHLRQKMIELQKYCIDKFMGIEEGIAILTRLTSIIQSKVTQSIIQIAQKNTPKKTQKHQSRDQQYEISRVIKKYHKKSTIPDNGLIKGLKLH